MAVTSDGASDRRSRVAVSKPRATPTASLRRGGPPTGASEPNCVAAGAGLAGVCPRMGSQV